MDLQVVITGLIGLFTTVLSGWLSYYFTREKYHTEVDHGMIENMKESLEFYRQLSDDNRKRLEEMMKMNAELEEEVKDLKNKVLELSVNICMQLTCNHRLKETCPGDCIPPTLGDNK